MPPSEYYRDGYNLYQRMVKYRHNHLLFLSNPHVAPDNNLCERKARILKGKINQAISLRSFEHLTYFCECLSVRDIILCYSDKSTRQIHKIKIHFCVSSS